MDEFTTHRGHVWAVAYRLLGTVSDADDAVQDAWLRWQRVDQAGVEDAKAYLTTIVTRICYDALASARARRESYVGQWLPEPVVSEPGPEDQVALDESVSLALLAVFERLSAAERTSLVLHDVFAVPFGEIADIVGRTEGAVRQLAATARARVRRYAPASGTDRPTHLKAVRAFATAATTGNLPDLVAVLDPGVVWRADGGGVVTAARVPVSGAQPVAKLVLGMVEKWFDGMSAEFADVNGSPGVLIRKADGTVDSVLGFTIADGRITEVDVVRNPAKLAHLAT